MSSPLAGKFQDHYAILGIDPKSDSDTIQKAYSKLAQKYYPNNSATANAEMFEAVNAAYETLSDPELRGIFDKLKGVGQEEGGPKFSGVEFFDALGREALRRAAILCVLYDRRLSKPSTPSLSMRHLELIVEATAAELSSAIWYLKQRGLAASDDKSSMVITVDGMDFLESKRPSPEDVMRFIKSAAVPAVQAQPKREGESVMTALNRVLAKTPRKSRGELIGSSDVAGRYDRHIMATPLDAKFQDHYAILQVDPQAVSETIQRAYSKLAQKYNSRNADTGDARMFAALNLAYEVLSDPARRKEFDTQLGISQEGSSPKFSGVGFFDALGPDAGLRTAILCLLYDRRRTRPSAAGLSMRQVEIMVEATAVELSAALWYMKQRALVSSDDKSNMQITVEGMDFLVGAKPVPADVMAFIKPAAVAGTQPQSPLAPLDTAPGAPNALSTLERAVARMQDHTKRDTAVTAKE